MELLPFSQTSSKVRPIVDGNRLAAPSSILIFGVCCFAERTSCKYQNERREVRRVVFVMDHVSPPGTSPGGLPRPSPPDSGDDRELGGVADPAIPVHEGYNEMIRQMGEEPLLFGGIEAPHVEPPPSIEESALVDSARALGLPLENILLPNSPSEETSRRMAALYSGAKYILSDELFDFEQVRVSQMGFIFHLVEGAGRWRSHEKLLYRLHDAGGWKEERTLPASSLRAAAEYMVQLQGIFAAIRAAGAAFEKE